MGWYYRLGSRLGHTRLFRAIAPRVLTPLDRFLYPRTRGRLISVGAPVVPVLMLTTTGRRSGDPHEVPLLYLTRGDGEVLVVASNWGRKRHPGWSANLIADPAAVVQRGDDRFPVTARLLDAAEKAKVWPAVCELWPAYATYERVSGRDVRVFALRRDGTGRPDLTGDGPSRRRRWRRRRRR
jgi:deazaflavin-dependent oxidoreductase (nitroreductase family)